MSDILMVWWVMCCPKRAQQQGVMAMNHADEKDLESEMPKIDAEWYIRRAMEEDEANACTEIFQRLRRIYRADSLQTSSEIQVFLRDMTYFTYECEQNARRNGLMLNPLTPLELESAFPLGGSAMSKLVETYRSGKEEPGSDNGRTKI